MPPKIERAAPRPQPLITRARAGDVSRTQAPSPATSQPLELRLDPKISGAAAQGAPLAASAAPGSLWGPSPRETAAAEFCALSPVGRADRLEELKQERDDVRDQIATRCDKLDDHWGYLRLSKRVAALEEYGRHSRQLDPGTRAELTQVLDKASEAQKAVDDLKARYRSLGDSPADVAEKTRLRKQLRSLLRTQSKAVKAAVAAVDAKGLRLDRLAETEQVIDKKVQPGGTLLNLVEKFVDLSWLVDTFVELCQRTPKDEEERRQQEVSEQRLQDDIRKDRERRQRALEELASFERIERGPGVRQA